MSRIADDPDALVNRLAARQHGALSRRQALNKGFTRHMVQSRLMAGRWHRTRFVGVYRVAGHAITWQHHAMAASLSGPDGTVVSHTTAAALYGLTTPPDEPHVTFPPSASIRQAGLVAHRSPLRSGERCTVAKVPATVPTRTLVDCAQILDAPELMAVVDTGLCRRLTTPAKVLAAAVEVSATGRRRGLGVLREVLAVWADGIQPGSPAEMRLLRRIDRWAFPPPHKQFEVRDAAGRFVARLDLAWPDRRGGLEYDGQEYHGPRQWEADEARHTRLLELGWRIERVEKIDLLDGATRLLEALAALLSRAA